MHAPLGADVVHRHDVGVLQVRRRLGLVLEALQLAGVEGGGERQHLQGHAPAQEDLHRLVHHAHAASADLADDAEVSQRPFRLNFRRRYVLLVPGWLTQQRGGRLHEFQAIETAGQRLADLGMAGQKRPAIRFRTGFQSGEIILHGLDHPRVVQGHGSGLLAHDGPPSAERN
jgi:hypothetical protein